MLFIGDSKSRFCAVIAMLLGPQVAASSESVCSYVANDQDRLNCYDLVYGRAEPEATTANTHKLKWRISSSVSAMTDAAGGTASVDSLGPAMCGSVAPQPLTLVIRCSEGETAVFISGQCQFTSEVGDLGMVMYRIDDGFPFFQRMTHSSDNRALGIWDDKYSITFIKNMIGHETFRARLTPYNQSPVEAEFPISGVGEAIQTIREACNW